MKKLYFLCLVIFAFSANETAPQKDANATVSASKILPASEKTQTAPKNLIPSQSGVKADTPASKQNAAPQAAKKNANATKSENKSAAKTLATAKDINSTDSNASGAKKQDANASGAKPALGTKKSDENASAPNAAATAKLDTNAAKPAPSASQPLGALPPVVPDEIPIRPEILPAAPNTPPAAPPPLKNFTSRSFSLPSDALAIEQITVRYTDSDGTSHEKIIDINRSINWQDDFIISASAKPALQRALDVSVTSKDPNLKNQTPQASAASSAPRLELPLETLKFDDELRFVIHQNNIQIITADEFKSSDANASGVLEAEFWRQEIPLSGASFAVNIGGFSDINVTKEDGYYRIGVRSREGNLSIRRKDGGYLIYKN